MNACRPGSARPPRAGFKLRKRQSLTGSPCTGCLRAHRGSSWAVACRGCPPLATVTHDAVSCEAATANPRLASNSTGYRRDLERHIAGSSPTRCGRSRFAAVARVAASREARARAPRPRPTNQHERRIAGSRSAAARNKMKRGKFSLRVV